ncbi:MAG: hypothetical protein JWR19_532 [Pedosphaera sp.]|nr:hypothetical protein [Pedosphaera sp.]
MSKRLTVFYSWRSDTPSNLNRNFIEKALVEALKRLHSDATLENALRDTSVELDKDTKGVAGSPPIAETILRKIEDCAVFVADLTFVGESLKGLTNAAGQPRLFPNPNALMEYGYALKCHSHAALLGIMNTAYGKPSAESLPFDLRHLRWPIAYHLSDSSVAEKEVQFEKLVGTLVEAIRLILTNLTPVKIASVEFVPHKPTINAATFHVLPSALVPEDRSGQKPEPFIVPDNGKAYLRVFPTVGVTPITTELQAVQLVRNGCLPPMGEVSGWNTARNVFGAIVYEQPNSKKLYHFTQLFLSREIWGVDASCVNAAICREYTQGKSFIASNAVEEVFVLALHNYLKFSNTHLQLPLPLRLEAGLVKILGYQIGVGNRLIGKTLQDNIEWQSEVTSYEAPSYEILEPFFNLVWSKCGVERPSSRQAELAKRFQNIN